MYIYIYTYKLSNHILKIWTIILATLFFLKRQISTAQLKLHLSSKLGFVYTWPHSLVTLMLNLFALGYKTLKSWAPYCTTLLIYSRNNFIPQPQASSQTIAVSLAMLVIDYGGDQASKQMAQLLPLTIMSFLMKKLYIDHYFLEVYKYLRRQEMLYFDR